MKKNIGTIGFIGAGNMGGAIITRLAESLNPHDILVYDTDATRSQALAEKLGIETAGPADTVRKADILILAVKPDRVAAVLKEAVNSLKPGAVIVSIAAGVSLAAMEAVAGNDKKIVRVMPNTPAMAGEGMSVISANKSVGDDDLAKIEYIFSLVGKTASMPEKLFDAVTALSGSGPAYVFTFIQALADGGVKMGLPRDSALLLAAQTVLGSAKLLIETGDDPITLRSRVASPGGTTIEGIHVLEKSGFSGTIMDAVEAAALKSKRLGEK